MIFDPGSAPARVRIKSRMNLLTLSPFTGILFCLVSVSWAEITKFPENERIKLRDESRDMFYHAYNAYLEVAFPADELMPLSCKGRFRGVEQNRGDIDEAMGNFSLTLIDSLSTLVVLGDIQGFEKAVQLTIDNVKFDHDIVVSVFETNIRIVGGLISAHVLSEYLRDRYAKMTWYQGELLDLALDVGYKLLPAFNSTTGLPHPRVNLLHGIKSGKIKVIGETCTACAGTMILEFAALSRLSGEPIFEEKAAQAMDRLWASRHRQSNLVGNVLNINTGDWVRKDSGIGAGIDSYYEYVAKAYVLLGEDKYLNRWTTHYEAIMKYLGQQPLLQDVHMHKPQTNSRHFVDSLGAFWPGLQVLMGDIKPAIESHEVLYQVMQRHNFIPEAFTTDFQVHWGQHLLRPEFLESTYFLYKATGDDHYLEVGKKVLESIQKHARVPCGYATLKDVRTLQKEDRLDSFVLAETFKYLYLLFAKDEDLILDLNDFVFTTEAHLLPLSLARLSNRTAVPLRKEKNDNTVVDHDVETSQSCPSTDYLFPPPDEAHSKRHHFAYHIRFPLANLVNSKCPLKKSHKRRLYASEFQTNNPDHMDLIRKMGISIVSLPDGRVQLLHTLANAASADDGEEGLLFMQEMIELSKQASTVPDTPPRVLTFLGEDPISGKNVLHSIVAGPAQFGKSIEDGFELTGMLVKADPPTACLSMNNGNKFWGKIVIVERGDCMFVEKARNLESLGAKGGIVLDNVPGSSSKDSPLFAMSGDGTDDVSIPVVFVFTEDAKILLKELENNPDLMVTMQETKDDYEENSASDENSFPSAFDFAAPVQSFIEKSKKQMEKYFGNMMSQTEPIRDEGIVEADDGTKFKYKEDAKGSIHIRSLTDEEVEELMEKQTEDNSEINAPIPQVLVDTDDSLVNMEQFENELPQLNFENAEVVKIFKTHIVNNGLISQQRFVQAKTRDLVKLLIQTHWEKMGNAKLLHSLEVTTIIISEMMGWTNNIDQRVSDFVDASIEAVEKQVPNAVLDFQVFNLKAKITMNDKDSLKGFVKSKISQFQLDDKEEDWEQKLLVYPILFHTLENLKSNVVLAINQRKDEL